VEQSRPTLSDGALRHKIHRRNCQPEPAITIGSNIYGGRVSTIVVALIVGTLGAFLSYKGYVRSKQAGAD
jgi:hypothetical protein